MSNGEGPPPIFEEDDFPYWKIRMEAYLEAIDVGCLRAATDSILAMSSSQPTPSQTTVLTTTEISVSEIVAHLVTGTGTTETVPSLVASTDPPTIGTL
jgi:hypothetical protein